MKKYRILSMVLALVTLMSVTVGAVSAKAVYRLRSGDFIFKVLNDGTLEAESYLGEEDTDVNIPSDVFGYEVSVIGNNLFGTKSLIKVTVPDTVITMKRAFTAPVKTLVIGKNVSEFNMYNLTNVTNEVICNSKYLTILGKALYNKSMTRLIYCPIVNFDSENTFKVPDSVKIIGGNAFSDLADHKTNTAYKVDLNKATKIEYGAFAFTRFTAFTISSKVKNIEENAFFECVDLTDLKLTANKNLQIRKGAFSSTGIKSIKLSGYIGETAFANCKNLKKITLTSNVKEIGKRAFLNCNKLKTVTVPKNVEKIGKEAFGYKLDKNNKAVAIKGFTIKGAKGSAAEKYAKNNGFTFKAVKE